MKFSQRNSEPKKINSSLPWRKLGMLVCVIFTGTSLWSMFLVDKAQKNAPKMVVVDVPTRPIIKGEKLSKVPFTKVHWPYASSMDHIVQDVSLVQEHQALSDLPAYTPISKSGLKNVVFDVNAVVQGIPSGYRAITVKVDIESVVEGWAQAGSYVDVILLRRSPDPESGMEAKVIAENVKILAAGATVQTSSDTDTASSTPQTVTLLVTQNDALKIRTASTIGKLTFALRGLEDTRPAMAQHVTQRSLLGSSRSLSARKRSKYKGHARGPDGQLYTLDSDSGWVKNLVVSESETLRGTNE